MADEKQGETQTDEGSIDYTAKQAEIDKAKAKAADADRERLAEESQ